MYSSSSSSKQNVFPSSSNSLPSTHNYKVFLNFRGEDTRKSFVSYLYRELCEKEIKTFIDRELENGDHLPSKLPQAIKDSELAVVVLSKSYTTSKWCLMELVLIMELWRLKTLKVYPIFYDVDPSDVRKQRGSYSLEHYKENSSTAVEIPKWTEALTCVANLKGVDSKTWDDDYPMLQKIVEDISSQLSSTQPTSFDHLVCMEVHTERMKRLLEIESEGDGRMVGIWGMGGIGKTTIASYLYHQFARGFPAHCYIENVGKISETVGLKGLQKRFLGTILRSKNVMDLSSVQHGVKFIQSKLGALKVFVVLDDVDKVEQIHALAEQAGWFGKGSRIIITTRDKRLLDSSRVGKIYKVECLDSEDSLKLFKYFAFTGGDPPFDHFDDRLAVRASQLANGVPFALKALGEHFRGAASITDWEVDMDAFERAPHKEIMDTLRYSYTNLGKEKMLDFLRIACLFDGEHVSRVSALLHETGASIKGLTDKSLIRISSDGFIEMHSLIRQMGREIVREESGYKPQKQAILWDHHNSYGVLKGNSGTENIEGMALHMCELQQASSIDGNPFEKMPNLKFLKFFKHLDVVGSNLDLSSDNCISLPWYLRLLHWDAYPLTALPSKFPLNCLVELRLRYSNLNSLWDGKKNLPMLKILDVTGSKNLIKLPDLSSALYLEELITKGCTGLTQILETTDKLTRLRKLDISNCDNLMELEMVIRDFPELHRSSDGTLQKVAEKFPDAVATTNFLKNLSIECQILFRLNHLEGKVAHLSFSSEKQIRCALSMTKPQKTSDLYTDFNGFKTLNIMQLGYNKYGRSFEFKSFVNFVVLTELNLINLNMHKVEDDIELLKELQKLDLSGNDFRHLPKEMENLSKLKSLRLCNCRILSELPQLTQLETLKLSDCVNLRSFPHNSEYLLQKLWLDNCKSVQNLSNTLRCCTNLTYLDLSRNDFETMPASIISLPLLGTLCLNDCNNLKSLTELPLSLKYLYAHGCKSLETANLTSNHSIKHFDLRYCTKLNEVEHLISQFLTCGQNKEVSQRFACLPGSKVPSYFDNQATSSPTIWHTSAASAGFDACIIISCESPFHLQLSYTCKKENNQSYRINLKPDIFLAPESISSNKGEAVSTNHLFIFHVPEIVELDEFFRQNHLEFSKEVQPALGKTVSDGDLVIHKIPEDDREHDISCQDLSENGKPEDAENVKDMDDESMPKETTDCWEITEKSGDRQKSEYLSEDVNNVEDKDDASMLKENTNGWDITEISGDRRKSEDLSVKDKREDVDNVKDKDDEPIPKETTYCREITEINGDRRKSRISFFRKYRIYKHIGTWFTKTKKKERL